MQDEQLPLTMGYVDITKNFGISKQTVCKYVREGRFPKPVRIAQNVVRFRTNEILSWFERHAGDDCPSEAPCNRIS